MTIMLTSSPRQTLLLRLPRWQALPAAVAAGRGRASAGHGRCSRPFSGCIPFRDEMKRALERPASRCSPRPTGWQLCCWCSALLPAGLRGTGLPRLHPLRLPAPGPQVAGDRLQRRLLRHDPRLLAAIDHRLPAGHRAGLPGRADRQHPARHRVPLRPQRAGDRRPVWITPEMLADGRHWVDGAVGRCGRADVLLARLSAGRSC